ncbi:Uu.00g006320.m01.CDS01 [Anthostomella pinea]|uniref:Uu.00g006320.m01.CDS01 n=1 Tax=Anthostomella pinea TaxID=933095 RepID=A0AAI8VKY0_9PEZI|nr:Uu.00g006320.m01.CDS01 [Anthostomella pinea]
MHLATNIAVALVALVTTAQAAWRMACGKGGNAQFHIIHDRPYLSTLCSMTPDDDHKQMCTMLDLGGCYQNSNGHLLATINGRFEHSCQHCHLTGVNKTIFACDCQMFGKNAPWQYTEIETEDLIENQAGFLTCWNAGHQKCPGMPDVQV